MYNITALRQKAIYKNQFYARKTPNNIAIQEQTYLNTGTYTGAAEYKT